MANASKQNAVSASGVVRAPDGFRRIGSVDAPWFNIKPGNTLLAVLDNLYERDDVRSNTGKSQFFQLTLLEPAEVRQGKGGDVQLVMAPAGTVVSLNYTPKTKPLELHIPDIVRGAEFQVWIGCGQKKQLKNGNTMWDLDVRVNQTKLVKSEAAPDFDGGADEAAGE